MPGIAGNCMLLNLGFIYIYTYDCNRMFFVIYLLFKIESITEIFHRLSHIYLVWPIASTVLHSMFSSAGNDLCFPHGQDVHGNRNLVIDMVLFTLESFMSILIVIQAVMIINHVGQSRKYAKRKWSTKDTKLLCWQATISINSLIRWVCLLMENILTLIPSDGNVAHTEFVVFFILPMNCVVTPVVFTLATCKFTILYLAKVNRKMRLDESASNSTDEYLW